MPLSEVVHMALRAIDDNRMQRVGVLLNITRKFQTSISISARLPGFKRQAVDLENFADSIAAGDPNKLLLERWVVVKRMLTRYNWLSTRIGDDAVPVEGFVQGLILSAADLDGSKPELNAIDMLVPIRQRRFEEMFGKQWESIHFFDSPHPSNIKVYVDKVAYQQAHRRELENLKKLHPIGAKAVSA